MPTKTRSAPSRACCATTAQRARTLHPGFALELFRDEAEGYYLNLSSGAPVWFVDLAHRRRRSVARLARDGEPVVQRSRPLARRAGARRQRAAAAPRSRAWLQAYTDEHYRPEPKKRAPAAVVRAAGGAASERARRRRLPVALVAAQGAGRASGAPTPSRRRAAAPPASPCRRAAPRRAAPATPRRSAAPSRAAEPAAEPPPLPTLDDVAAADARAPTTRRFVAPDVDARRQATRR